MLKSLQHLQKDLLKISNLPRCEECNVLVYQMKCVVYPCQNKKKKRLIFRHLIASDAHVDLVLNGRIGSITPSKEGKVPVSSKLLVMNGCQYGM